MSSDLTKIPFKRVAECYAMFWMISDHISEHLHKFWSTIQSYRQNSQISEILPSLRTSEYHMFDANHSSDCLERKITSHTSRSWSRCSIRGIQECGWEFWVIDSDSSFTRLDWLFWLGNNTTLSEVVMNLDRELTEWLFSWRGSNCIDHIRFKR
jgi:hypothetical protein